jgi:hypothetical protein
MTSTARTRLSIVAGSLLGIASLCVAAVGVFGLSASHSGYVDLGNASFHTNSYAVVSEPYDWSKGRYLFGKFGKVRVTVTPAAGSSPTFVGLAPAQSVYPYLDGVGYVIAHGKSGHVSYEATPGGAPSSSSLVPWISKATGTNTMTLRLQADTRGGDIVVVAMHADRSAVIAGRVKTEATVPDLTRIAVTALVVGLVVLAGSIWLIVAPIRRRRAARARLGS